MEKKEYQTVGEYMVTESHTTRQALVVSVIALLAFGIVALFFGP